MTTSTGDIPVVRPARAAGAHRAPRLRALRRLAANIWAVLTGQAR